MCRNIVRAAPTSPLSKKDSNESTLSGDLTKSYWLFPFSFGLVSSSFSSSSAMSSSSLSSRNAVETVEVPSGGLASSFSSSDSCGSSSSSWEGIESLNGGKRPLNFRNEISSAGKKVYYV